MLRSADVRRNFLHYFRRHGHEIVPSASLIPHNLPAPLFTSAGMSPFAEVFTGRETRPYLRAASSQKCLRASGTHNDLHYVGRTARHHTFFEMLGNFSFGDYFKEDAIVFTWELLTKEFAIDPSRLLITVFRGDPQIGLAPDDEARRIWRRLTGFGDERIIGLGMQDNFWSMGDAGPQGPCSEIQIWNASSPVDLRLFHQPPLPDGTGWLEIWNLVFMQFQRESQGAPLVELPRPSIDTGGGLERLSAVLQGVRSSYDTDLLMPLVTMAAELSGRTYGRSMSDEDVAMRVLADHARAAAFLIADGVRPSDEGRGQVLRAIMRRAFQHGGRLALAPGSYRKLCEWVIEEMGGVFPELCAERAAIIRTVDHEETAFPSDT